MTDLKLKYEHLFIEKKLMDESLILLKSELENTLKNPPKNTKKNHNIGFILNKKKLIEKAIKQTI